jgi:hypothetical protein
LKIFNLAVPFGQNLYPVVKRSFYYWGELFLNKILTLTFDCRPAGDNPTQRFRSPPLRFGKQNRKIF